ncbi:hypothetical protein EP1X_09695 [Thermococcus sp. EP1]|uniref:DUF2178 domain-containing protein n=1 Tax=Thermococcus sp. EP1 TaxID=1591054 RepID=UPI0006D9DB1F|nr:DUF2178 domain-containing protein [Thermococcus sp. EP1]KPU62256.1 hypothetical protein EP1X_09695 [Thermococcus sp. EP1]
MINDSLFLFIVIATVVYWFIFYRFMKETGQMKDERGRHINQMASEATLIIVQMLLLIGLLAVEVFKWLDAGKMLAFVYVVAIFGHTLVRYYYVRVM